MGFEKYSKIRTIHDQKAAVTLHKTGRLMLNGKCLAEHMPKAAFVHLFYDPKERLVGLKPLGEKDKDRDAYALISTRKSSSRFIHAVGFFKHYGLTFEKTQRFEPRWDEKTGLLVIELRAPQK